MTPQNRGLIKIKTLHILQLSVSGCVGVSGYPHALRAPEYRGSAAHNAGTQGKPRSRPGSRTVTAGVPATRRTRVLVTPRNITSARHTTLKHRASHDLDGGRGTQQRTCPARVVVRARARVLYTTLYLVLPVQPYLPYTTCYSCTLHATRKEFHVRIDNAMGHA